MAFFSTENLGNNLLGVGLDFLAAKYNNKMAADREAAAREENYKYGEMAADAADTRTRNLYGDLYSPSAQLEQIKNAGLSPSIYASGGIAGKSGVSGAMGTGAGSVSPQTYGVNPLAAAQLGLIKAQTRNLNSEAEGKETDNIIKDFEAKLKEMQYFFDKGEKTLMSAYITNNDGTTSTLLDWANIFDSYEGMKKGIESLHKNKKIDNDLWDYINTVEGDKKLRDIYKYNKQYQKEILQIEGDKAYAQIFLDIQNKLAENDFADKTVKQQIAEINKIIEASNLEAKEKKTINDLFNGIENEGVRNAMMIIYMLANRYLGSLNGSVSINGNKNNYTN